MAWSAADITAVETAIRALISGGAVQEYSLRGGQNTKFMTLKELRDLRAEMSSEINIVDDGYMPGVINAVPERWGANVGNLGS